MALGRLTYTDKDYKYLLDETYKLAWSKHPLVRIFRQSHLDYDKVLKSYKKLNYDRSIELPFVFSRSFVPTVLTDIGGQIPNIEDMTGLFYWSVLDRAGFSFDFKSYRLGLTTSVLPVNTLVEYQGSFYRILESFPTNFVGEDFFLAVGVNMEVLQRGSIRFSSDSTVIFSIEFGFVDSLPSVYDTTTLIQLQRTLQRTENIRRPYEFSESYRFVKGYFVLYVDLERLNNTFSGVQISTTPSLTFNTVDLGYVGDKHVGLIHSTTPITSPTDVTVEFSIT